MSTLLRILYVEDEPDIQAVVRLALEMDGGFEVKICSSGEESVREAEAFAPDLILLDVMMPGMDGPSTLQALRMLPALVEAPVAFMTAKVQPAEIAHFRSLGAYDVIPKPFDPMTLPDQLRAIWGAWRSGRQSQGSQPNHPPHEDTNKRETASGTSTLSAAMQELSHKFVAQLSDQISAMLEQYQRVVEGGYGAAEIDSLHRLLHGLSGAAGIFGMQSVSAAARQLEVRLTGILQAGVTPDVDTWTTVGAELTRIAHLAHSQLHAGVQHHLTPPVATPRLDRMPLVYLVEDDVTQAEHLTTALREDGYQVRLFTALDDFRAACAEAEYPDAVVLDVIFPEGYSAGIELLEELKAAREHCPPVVFTSVRDDLEARVAAYRAGASRYLLKPVAPGTLIDLLDVVTGRMPPEPYRILLVDDDPLLLEAQASVLRAAGMTVQTLAQPRDTLNIVDRFRPDIVVLDVYMPVISGPELAAILRERDEYQSLPILFLSAETDMRQQLMALNLGGDDFLVKPVQPDHLVSAVTARARRARQNRAVQQRLRTSLYEREREHLALEQHAIVSIADAAGNITYVNDKFCQTSGYSRDELLGRNHRIVKSDQHPQGFYRDLWHSISRGEVWQGEICNRRKTGELYWVASTITPFVDEHGVPYQYVSIRTDITNIKHTEAMLRAQNAMRAVVGEATAGLLAAGADSMDAAIEQALHRLGEHLGVDRACLFLLTANDTRMGNSHEWCAPGIAPQNDYLQDISRETSPWLWPQLLRDQPVIISDVAELPPEATAEMAMFKFLGIPALCAFPIRRGDKTLGFMSFEHQTGCNVDATSLDLLRLLANQIGSALLRAAGEQALAANAQRLNATLESTNDGILAVDDKGEVLFMNQQFRRMWNLPESLADPAADVQLLEHAQTQLVDPQSFLEKVQTLYHSDEESRDLLELRDGRVFERHSQALQNGGKLSGRVWSFHDITERRRAEQVAEAAKERLRRGQMYANIGTWEWNITNGELFWTERIAPLFGYPLGDLATTYENFLAAVHPDDRQAVIDAVDASIERDAPYAIEHRVVWPDGTVRWLLERGAVVRDAEGKPLSMLGVVQDIDERKHMELELISAREAADHANQAKSEFLSSMSHELRTPLNAILGFGQLMEYDKTLGDDHLNSVREILKAGQHLLELINEVLDLARIESGQVDLSLEPVSIRPVFDECTEMLAPLAHRNDITLSHAGRAGMAVRADRVRFKQALLNLLSNAIKYNRKGGTVRLDLQPAGTDRLRVRVTDTGKGIPAQRMAGLFQPFNRLGAEAGDIEGSGIGLSITQRIAELMGGSIGVTSEFGVGSCFWIELPLAEEGALSAEQQAMLPADGVTGTDAEMMQQHSVLCIEDNPANIKLITHIFNRLPQVRLLSAHTPALGIELAQTSPPDLILLDINMQGMDGYEVLRVLKADARLKDTPVIAITANAMPRDIERGRAAGFSDYLTKPLDIPGFIDSVNRHLAGRPK